MALTTLALKLEAANMANLMVTIDSLSCKDIDSLALLFERSFDYYVNESSIFFEDYHIVLKTVVGLGFAAVLADKHSLLLSVYQTYLRPFLQAEEGNFLECPGQKTMIAQCCANMVGTAVVSFSALRCPDYYQDFLTALKGTIIANLPRLDHEKEAQRILKKIAVRDIFL
jgi:hypothetical protein